MRLDGIRVTELCIIYPLSLTRRSSPEARCGLVDDHTPMVSDTVMAVPYPRIYPSPGHVSTSWKDVTSTFLHFPGSSPILLRTEADGDKSAVG